MKKILYFLLHGESCMDRVDNVINTWGKGQDVVFYSDYTNESKNVFKVTDKKSYWDLEEKQYMGFKFLKENFINYDWYFFADDDTFVNTSKMDEFLNECDEKVVYGYFINYWSDGSLFFPSGGAGTLIHKNILVKLIDNLTIKNTSHAPDVTLGMNLVDLGISTSHCNLFHCETPEIHKVNYNEISDKITFHHIKTFNEMKNFDDLCKKRKI